MNVEFLQVRVAKKELAASNVALFELVDANNGALPAFTAGSHIDVHISRNCIRQYSLCNDPSETHRYCLGVKLAEESRGGSRAMLANVQEGETLQVSKPRNAFELQENYSHTILIAGGIGITPLLSMAHRLHHLGKSFEFHYCTRSKADAVFRGRLFSGPFADKVQLHFDDGAPEQRLDIERLLKVYPDHHQLYVCGPQGLMDIVVKTAAPAWPEGTVHLEYFSQPPDTGEADVEFTVKLARSGTQYAVSAGETILEVLQRNQIPVTVSCEQGVCGTCLVDVLDGVPDHRDSYQMDFERAENKRITICCSRSHSETLVLDL